LIETASNEFQFFFQNLPCVKKFVATALFAIKILETPDKLLIVKSAQGSMKQVKCQLFKISLGFSESRHALGSMGSISPTFYAQILPAQIPKVQKIQSSRQSVFRFWDLHT